jgi:hypothetical protein
VRPLRAVFWVLIVLWLCGGGANPVALERAASEGRTGDVLAIAIAHATLPVIAVLLLVIGHVRARKKPSGTGQTARPPR